MFYNLLLEMDQDTEFELLTGDEQYEIGLLDAVWLEHITPGTDKVSLKKVMHCIISSDTADIATFVNALIISYSVGWTVLGLQSFEAIEPIIVAEETVGYQAEPFVALNTSAILDYIRPRDGQTKDISWLHTFADQAPWRT